jgi:hypothetical protein
VSPAPHAHAAAPLPFDAAAKGREFLKRGEEFLKTEGRAGKLKEGGRVFEKGRGLENQKEGNGKEAKGSKEAKQR